MKLDGEDKSEQSRTLEKSDLIRAADPIAMITCGGLNHVKCQDSAFVLGLSK